MTDETFLLRAFDAIAEHGWSKFHLAGLLPENKLVSEGYLKYRTKYGLMRAFASHLDEKMLAVKPADMGDSDPKERLFELIMRRFDAMRPFKAGLQRLAREAAMDPRLLLTSHFNVRRMSSWLVELADPELSGLRRMIGERAVIALYVRVFQVWLEDNSEDCAKTMAELDKRLGQLERLARWTGDRQRAPDRKAEGGDTEASAE